MCTEEGRRGCCGPPRAEVTGSVIFPSWMLGTELGSCAGAVDACNSWSCLSSPLTTVVKSTWELDTVCKHRCCLSFLSAAVMRLPSSQFTPQPVVFQGYPGDGNFRELVASCHPLSGSRAVNECMPACRHSLLPSAQGPVQETVPPIFQVGLSTSVNTTEKIPHRHGHKPT